MQRRNGSAGGLLAWVSTLALGTWLFHGLGEGGLAAPPWPGPAFLGWLAETEPLWATMALLRVLVLALAWYLVGVTMIGGLSHLTRAARLIRLADAVTVPAVRRLLQSALGVGLATAMVGAAAPARAEPLPLQVLDIVTDDATAGGSGAEPDRRAPPDREVGPVGELPVVLQLLDQYPGAADPPAATVAVAAADASGPASTEYRVVAGDSFWTIAKAQLTDAHGTSPDDAQVVVHWRQLVEDNRDRLADPDNPDLLFPGQRLALPAVEPTS
ncbi:LysM peptidoglycan-binding domain-containing protein [Egicoccus sp. AB-alg2]|uniref:LysM peptidoglycan-binding domain-containing protein n=1 Tax=Egicoccus sp. AB-alg2 TaxID=3242693 RepID=UPI00359F0C51